ncbi:prolyl oligopeptidase family serine peptidase [Chitinophaga sancti]|uniref:alpha/beta hydrolase family protein n=1 Tax=Chitinophaga sancti TaxID=1004 RepID=UPI002A757BF4|nr:prolyl oligopeptidase family serine peptidase [Chitinophaga sancti]WPQ63395.1 prolyl oligopeptidase family serine peptidase [Chitinophaga sancti]
MPVFLKLLLITLSFKVNVDTTIIQLEDSTTVLCATGEKYALTQNKVNAWEYYWNHPLPAALYLTELNSGKKLKIAENPKGLVIHASLSPSEKYVSWYDTYLKSICIYNIASSSILILQKNIQCLPQWFPDDSAFIVYDQYDIWKIIPGRNMHINLTNGYGRKHKIIFRQLTDSILVAFNTINKQNGFFKLTENDPKLLSMDDCLYYFPIYPLDEFKPVKSIDSTTWLLLKQDAGIPPSYYSTSDFKTFYPIDSFKPPTLLKSTIIRFKHITGILYTPLTFDSSKKYPLIITYYQNFSNNLHKFQPLQNSEGTLNIPTYISSGYMVFVPDIKTKKGHPGPSTARIVARSAKQLRKYKWIDQKHIGLQGFSFGGYITNYVITHSRIFAAAQESAGPVDFISGYGSVKKGSNTSLQPLYERGQNNMWTTPWDNPRKYLLNSPIIKVQHITTPLLILHNENDIIVPYAQSMELFMAMRRLDKQVWWIQYKDEGHQLFKRENQEDFSRKQLEFFNHFLKGAPPPSWMAK